MFTGIIEELGTFGGLSGGRIFIKCQKVIEDVKVGDSIAVNGICLTVTTFTDSSFTADVMPETIKRTSLDNLKTGDVVNLERALRLSDRLGGHIVSGHIDGVGRIKSMKNDANAIIVTVEAPKELLRQIAAKGSVALDGMSLTVVDVDDRTFSVSLIPHTRDVTNFKIKKVNSPINIETDVLAKYVERLLTGKPTGLTKDFLAANGFI